MSITINNFSLSIVKLSIASDALDPVSTKTVENAALLAPKDSVFDLLFFIPIFFMHTIFFTSPHLRENLNTKLGD